MNICVVCGKEFEPSKNYAAKKTCSKECYSKYAKENIPEGFKKNMFSKGTEPHNKGIPQKEWMSEDAIRKCKNTHIQNQETVASPLSKEEGRYLPYNTLKRGTITKRYTTHKKRKK